MPSGFRRCSSDNVTAQLQVTVAQRRKRGNEMKTLIPGTMQRGPAWCWTSVALVALAAAGLPAASAAAATQAGGRASHRPAPVGTAYSWGNNAAGELGQGSHANSVVPKRVLRLPVNSIKAVSAGTDASLALTRI